MEIEEKSPIHHLYRGLVLKGVAFGAQRWLATMERMCERFATLMMHGSSGRDIGGNGLDWRVAGGLFAGERGDHAVSFVVAAAAPAIPSTEGKRSMMKLAQRMMSNFCSSIGASTGHRWTTLSGMNDVGVRVTVHKSVDPGQPSGVVLSAATSIRLPVSPESVFSFFRNEQTRSQVLRRSGSPPPSLHLTGAAPLTKLFPFHLQWDVLSNGNSVQEVAHISSGQHPGNCISLLRVIDVCNWVIIVIISSVSGNGMRSSITLLVAPSLMKLLLESINLNQEGGLNALLLLQARWPLLSEEELWVLIPSSFFWLRRR